MRSFIRVCKKAGFNSSTGFYYWKMFFTVIFKNPKGIEAAVNLAAMFIHFLKQKEYSVSIMTHTISELKKIGEEDYYARMLENNQRNDKGIDKK
jgi:maltodextrin utilization protein YvdJ